MILDLLLLLLIIIINHRTILLIQKRPEIRSSLNLLSVDAQLSITMTSEDKTMILSKDAKYQYITYHERGVHRRL